ncbi:MAG: UDP-glucose 4-epimerase family protein [Desulfobulbia bacterium]
MRVLVTGATGFVGRALCAELLRHGHAVCATLRHVEDSTRLDLEGGETIAVGPVNAATDWRNALAGCEVVVHLAARVHVMRDKATDPLTEFCVVNVEGTLTLARQASEAGVRRFVYLSSVKVNGEQTLPGRPFTEDDMPAPLDPYGISKYKAEEGLHKLAQQTGMEVVIIRPPLVYGPGVKANFLDMMCWLYKGVPLPFGAIHNRRSLVALDNLIDFIVTCINHPVAANQTFLVSDGEDFSTTILLRRVVAALDIPSRLWPVPQQLLEMGFKLVGKGDVAERLCSSLQVDIAKARILLGWVPPVRVDESLEKTARHFLDSQLQ